MDDMVVTKDERRASGQEVVGTSGLICSGLAHLDHRRETMILHRAAPAALAVRVGEIS